jgi:hypothetical protein
MSTDCPSYSPARAISARQQSLQGSQAWPIISRHVSTPECSPVPRPGCAFVPCRCIHVRGGGPVRCRAVRLSSKPLPIHHENANLASGIHCEGAAVARADNSRTQAADSEGFGKEASVLRERGRERGRLLWSGHVERNLVMRSSCIVHVLQRHRV